MLGNLFRQQGKVLGMNARILHYLRPLNTSQAIKIANNKLATKKLLTEANIPTPRVYGVLRSRRDVEEFSWTSLPASFVLKPNSGLGGSGILIVFGRNKKGSWVRSRHLPIDVADIRERVLNILDGNFSIGNIPDTAFFEQRVRITPSLKPYAQSGIPDIRVLVVNHVPVMAMLRLPTPESSGRANLHVGGIGVGIDLGSGLTTTAIHRDIPITQYPGTRLRLSGIPIEHFRDILLLATRTTQALNLGYAGVDIAIDREEGPLVLEVNARPGLSIQLANNATLRDRLRRLEELSIDDPHRAVDISYSLFGNHTYDSPRRVIGVVEEVHILDASGHMHKHSARIDTGAYRSSIDRELANSYGLLEHLPPEPKIKKTKSAFGKEERRILPLTFFLSGQRVHTEVTLAERGHLKHELLIGRRDLGSFLVDPTKKRLLSSGERSS